MLRRAVYPIFKVVALPAVRIVEASAERAFSRVQALHAEGLAELARLETTQLRALDEKSEVVIDKLHRTVAGQLAFTAAHEYLLEQLRHDKSRSDPRVLPPLELSQTVRSLVRKYTGLPPADGAETEADLLAELRFVWENAALIKPMLQMCTGRRVLYAGQCYYNLWYLSRALRDRGWKADLLNWDSNPASQIYYHGEDFRFCGVPDEGRLTLRFYIEALYGYDVFHFSNAHGISFGFRLQQMVAPVVGDAGEIHLLKALGKKIVYTNNGCLDGVSQSAFSRWGPESVCAICRWKNEPTMCSDELNLRWGRFRNSLSDYQCLLGGNRVDFNNDPRVHETPWVYCLDSEFWKPGLEIPDQFRIARRSERTLLLYHAVGNKQDRTLETGVNIKSSHVYLPLVRKLQAAGWELELLEPEGIPNRDVRYLQSQADIFLEMLTFGWFGANAREAMMLGKPVICYIRPDWLDSLRRELPEYADELPIVSATPGDVEEVLLDLMGNPDKRAELGRRGRDFMLKWHSSQSAASRFDEIYTRLLQDDPQLLPSHVLP